MLSINLRLFGFGARASGWDTDTRSISQGTTVLGVWERLRSSAREDELLSRIDERHVVFLLNGKLIPESRRQEAVLEEGDTVTFMVMAIGGQGQRAVAARRPRKAHPLGERR